MSIPVMPAYPYHLYVELKDHPIVDSDPEIVASVTPSDFEDGAVIGYYKLVATRVVHKKTTLKRVKGAKDE